LAPTGNLIGNVNPALTVDRPKQPTPAGSKFDYCAAAGVFSPSCAKHCRM
jgi:hypothetical protein